MDLVGPNLVGSCDILEDAFVVGVALDEATHDELFDPNLYGGGLRHELGDEKLDGLLLKRVVIDRTTSFHDFDDCSFDFVSAEVFNLLLHAGIIIFLTLLAYHHGNLVPEE